MGRYRYPGIPSILDTILRDATVYFIILFASQLMFQLFLFLAPVGDIVIRPGVVNRVVLIICVCIGGSSAPAGIVSSLFPRRQKRPFD